MYCWFTNTSQHTAQAAIRCHDSFEWLDNGHPKVQTPFHHDSVSVAASPDGEVIIQGRVRRLLWLWRGDVTMNRKVELMLWPARLHPCEDRKVLVLSAALAHWSYCAVHIHVLIGWMPSPLALLMRLRNRRDAGRIWVYTGCHFFKGYIWAVLTSILEGTTLLRSFHSLLLSPCIAHIQFWNTLQIH